MSGALRGGRTCVALASGHHGVKVKVNTVGIHEVTVDDVIHVAIQVLGEHVDVQICRQPFLSVLEAGGGSERAHALQDNAGIGRGDGPSVMGAHCWRRGVLGFESGELRWVLRHT